MLDMGHLVTESYEGWQVKWRQVKSGEKSRTTYGGKAQFTYNQTIECSIFTFPKYSRNK